MTEAINNVFGEGVAVALDSTSVKVWAPSAPEQKVGFLGLLENIEVEPASPLRVIVNSRTGTIVISGDVRVTPAVVTMVH